MKSWAVFAALAAGVSSGTVLASDYPSKPIVMIVPFAAGGPSDAVARITAQAMSQELGTQVLVDNVPGAGGTIGAAKAARAASDGYTLLLHHIGISTAPALYSTLSYNTRTAFAPVGLVTKAPMTIVARSNLAPTSLNDLITYVATQDGRTLFAHSGVGSASHLCGLLFMRAIGHKVTTVPYKSAGQSMNDLMGKQVDMTCDQTTNTTGPILSKAIKVYAITTTTRLASLQNVPTAGEAGLKGFELSVWHGVFAPAGLPPEIQRKLSQALVKSLQNAELGKRFRMINTEPVSEQEATPQQLHRLVLDEMDRWGPIIKDAGEFAD